MALYPKTKSSNGSFSFVKKDRLQIRRSDFPMCLNIVHFFEKQKTLSIMVIFLEHETLYNVYLSLRQRKQQAKINILLLEGQKSHDC